jgi:hypothetical protein
MIRIETSGWATMGFAAFLFGSGACAQAGARDSSTTRTTESSERSAASSPTPSASPATTKPSASPASAPTAAAGDHPLDDAKAGEIQGRVVQVDRGNNLTVAGSESAGLAFDQFKVDSSTDVTIGGSKASVNDVNPGDEVRASFSGTGDNLHVDRLQILPSAGAEPSTQGTSGSSEKKDSPTSSPK